MVSVCDFMPPNIGHSMICPVVEGRGGDVEMQMELIVRYNYGAITPWATAMGDGLVFVSGLVVTASDSIAPSVNQPEPIDISLVLRIGKDRSLFFARVVSVEAPRASADLQPRNPQRHASLLARLGGTMYLRW